MSLSRERENLIGKRFIESVVLPHNLSHLLQRLSEDEFSSLVKSVAEEVARRNGSLPAERSDARLSTHPLEQRDRADVSVAVPLKQGQINAIRASFKAGVKIPVIARQFRILPSDVKKVISR